MILSSALGAAFPALALSAEHPQMSHGEKRRGFGCPVTLNGLDMGYRSPNCFINCSGTTIPIIEITLKLEQSYRSQWGIFKIHWKMEGVAGK